MSENDKAAPEISQDAARLVPVGFVELTDRNGRPVFLRVDTIIAIDAGQPMDGTTLTTNMRVTDGGSLDWYVEESASEVAAAIAAATRAENV